MSYFAVQKRMRVLGPHRKQNFVKRLVDSKKQAKTKESCANTVQSLSLSLTHLLSKFANSLDPEDRPTYLIRGKQAYQEL